jgi:DNA-binding MarR family transcriptional regulator
LPFAGGENKVHIHYFTDGEASSYFVRQPGIETMDSKSDKSAQIAPDKARVIAACTCFKLRGAARRVTQCYDRFLQASGLKITQYSLLANLRHSEGLSVSALAEKMAMDRTTLTRNLKPLEEAGFVTLMAGPDKRTRTALITPAGKEAFRSAVPHWKRAQEYLLTTLGEDTVLQLHAVLDESMHKIEVAT